jgi:hypothetical protein
MGGGAFAAPRGGHCPPAMPPLLLPPPSVGMGFHFHEPDFVARSQTVNALLSQAVTDALGLS